MEDQDRSKWDRDMIAQAKDFLDQSAEGEVVSPFHLEAGIALCHCSAKSYAETNWRMILGLYDALQAIQPSPIYVLNRAIAVAQVEGPEAGIRALGQASEEPALRHYHLYDATLGELYRRAGDFGKARSYFESALQKANTFHDREVIERRLALCGQP
jgi:RNA polymerase sigma-70 factor (ECF subfamily)